MYTQQVPQMSGDPRTDPCCPHSSPKPRSDSHNISGNFPASGLYLSMASLTRWGLCTSCSHLFPSLDLHGIISPRSPPSSPIPFQCKGGPMPWTATTTPFSPSQLYHWVPIHRLFQRLVRADQSSVQLTPISHDIHSTGEDAVT